MNDQDASDLHLIFGQQPVLRISGELERVKYKMLDNDALKVMLYEIASDHKSLRRQEMLILPMKSQALSGTEPIISSRKMGSVPFTGRDSQPF